MAKGIDVLTALRAITQDKPAGIAWPIDPNDAKDLCKIKASDLEAAGWDGTHAEDVNSGLAKGIVEPIGRGVGLDLRQNPLALPLTGSRPSRAERQAQLRQINNSNRRDQVAKLLNDFYPVGESLVGVPTIETILTHEYPDPNDDG